MFAGEGFNDLPFIGKSTYKWFVFEIYDAKLWANSRVKFYTDKLKLKLTYKRSFVGKEILQQTRKELESAGHDNTTINDLIKTLEKVFPDVKKGDSISANYDPNNGVALYLNDKEVVGEIKNIKHSQIFLDIWLGETASDSKFRSNLIGGNE
ncbi:MAG: chalcone isomerase family protein [Bdellovibrionales bacterium]|nr:chalcone isomerase family protein [Bdellovibrionales bacterium]